MDNLTVLRLVVLAIFIAITLYWVILKFYVVDDWYQQ